MEEYISPVDKVGMTVSLEALAALFEKEVSDDELHKFYTKASILVEEYGIDIDTIGTGISNNNNDSNKDK